MALYKLDYYYHYLDLKFIARKQKPVGTKLEDKNRVNNWFATG